MRGFVEVNGCSVSHVCTLHGLLSMTTTRSRSAILFHLLIQGYRFDKAVFTKARVVGVHESIRIQYIDVNDVPLYRGDGGKL